MKPNVYKVLCILMLFMTFQACKDRGSKAKVWLNNYEPKSGDELIIYFTVPAHFPEDGWLAIVPSHKPRGESNWNDNDEVIFKQLISGRTFDSLRYVISDELTGSWDVRMYRNSTYGTEVFSIPFMIVDPTVKTTKNSK